MLYLNSFRLPSEKAEDGYLLSMSEPRMNMFCYSDTNAYPFKIFTPKRLTHIDFSQITMLYGGNGSGKSTLLNVIAQKLGLSRVSPFNNTPHFDDYLKLCHYELNVGKRAPAESKIITSDDVFDFLLDIRTVNNGIDNRRETLFEEYDRLKDELSDFKTLEDYEKLKLKNEVNRSTKSAFTSRRLPKSLAGKSNGESAFSYFTDKITDNALFLLDEPENSLSVKLQIELVKFLEESARFFGCQFVISTHSPFLLSIKDALIYNLDACPACTDKWTSLENVRLYFDFFNSRRDSFL